ncbi:carbamoyltransferase C-terminal domain-containing protein [Streptomyces sp. NPDC052114]|uniref:carbamoyltransferase family protein n=1 Tax=unclassified Streptomyces TaxID=2593676 RepID=UPI00343F6B4B
MIVLGYNGFSRIAELFGKLFGYTQDGVDRHSFLGHDAAAALFIDGKLVAAVEEERMNRQKKTTAFPINAMRWCLDQAGLDFDDVDYYAFGWKFTDEFADSVITRFAEAEIPAEYKLQAISNFGELYNGACSKKAILEDFERHTGHTLSEDKLITVPHHRAHLACGRTFAGFDDAAFIISDGQGERDSSIMGEIRDGEVKVFEQFTIDAANSIAQLFAEITRYLGFTPNNDEYKVMGLGGFGQPPKQEENPFLNHVVTFDGPGRYSLALANDPRGPRAYAVLFDEIFGGNDDNRGEFEFQVRVASAAQQMLEVVTAHQLRGLAEVTELRDLIYEGGVALNCVNNTKLLEDLPFERAEVSFGASDPGVSIGAAAHVVREQNVPLVPVKSPYLGPEFSAEEILAVLDGYTDRVTWEEHPDGAIVPKTADLLSGKTVIGWFQGRTEYGPRALGNRSILANPSHADMKDIINTRVKHREPFRPFAPIVLEENAAKVFELGKKERSPYMTFVFPVKSDYVDTIAAATHVDATSRIQTVTDESNARLATLLREFTARTDVPCLVNTSFNVAGEPVVNSPKDAVECFLGTDIDYLVLGDYLVTKR